MMILERDRLWDIAGNDGLQVVKTLAGDRITTIAPFQSIETTIAGNDCSILRLCEGNFRLAYLGNPNVLESAWQEFVGDRVWLKRFSWLGAISISESIGLDYLPQIAVPKPPHRLKGLECDRALPARINGISVLIWRHQVLQQPAFELHTAFKNLELIKSILDLTFQSKARKLIL